MEDLSSKRRGAVQHLLVGLLLLGLIAAVGILWSATSGEGAGGDAAQPGARPGRPKERELPAAGAALPPTSVQPPQGLGEAGVVLPSDSESDSEPAVEIAALPSIALADSWTDQTYGPAFVATRTTLTLRAPEGELMSIPEQADVTVLDSEGRPVDPQPPLRISPSLGTVAAQYIVEGAIGEGNSVRITRMSTTGIRSEPPLGRFAAT